MAAGALVRARERSTTLARKLRDAEGITMSGAAASTVQLAAGAGLAAVADAKLPEVAGQRPSTALAFSLFGIGIATKSSTAIRAAQGALMPLIYESVYARVAASEQAG